MNSTASVVIERCPLCNGREWIEDSVPEPNLYSEKIALILGQDEARVLREHANWRCRNCGLVSKRRWFAPGVIRALFHGEVAVHPKGWDAVLNRFSERGLLQTVETWALALDRQAEPEIRRGQRELRSLLDSITDPRGFDSAEILTAIDHRDLQQIRGAVPAIVGSIGEPAPFKRFSGFRSRLLWNYLQSRTGGFDAYAELGCPLWGLLSLAAETCNRVTYLVRDEPNYWGAGCMNAAEHCLARLLGDRRVLSEEWSAPDRYPVIGLFQYLDHLIDPFRFLEQLFSKADSAAIIMDGIGAPVAIQHVTGWTETSLAFVARKFGKDLHTDFDEIRPSGNHLFLFTPARSGGRLP